ncbi:hypothetical protein [Paenibacillus sp. Aloe-11]|uniref:hypothetical protein n=1 Tax=Paenibacillus sp. Aloe-11 TaxID=1050222 RepID=UPI00024EFFBA|nr:hypothetical protein [Paenibacillus sp. Aloe-11]EHS59469.1 hypothetical protein WG8_0684 [Paenibacillus sp. Aloe-11]
MATTNKNNFGVRQALNNKGVNNSRIGYSNGYVTVDGKNFLKPGSVANGSAMSSQQNFNNAWQGMAPTKPVSVPTVAKASPMVQAANNVRNNMTTSTFTPPTPRLEQTLNSLSGLANTQAAKLPEFKYDPQSDPAYQAALREAQANLATAQRNTNAGLRATGQGKSSYSETLANQLANRSMESIANTTLPQMMQQAYGRFIDKANYDQSAAQQQAAQLANLYGLQYQQDVTKPMAEAQLTGNYMPAEARQAINDILTFKNQAETKGTTAQQRADLSAQADNRRKILESLGINSAAYGANVNANNASQNASTGFRTLQGQQQDLQRKESNLNAANVVSQMTGRAVTPQDDWQGLNRQANNPNTPLTLQAQQQNFNNSLAARQQEFNEGQQDWENDFSTAQFGNTVDQQALQNAWNASDRLGYVTSELSSLTGIPQGIRTLDARQFEYGVEKDRAAASQGMTAEKYAKDYLDNQVIKSKDADDNTIITNKPDIEKAILAAPLSEYEQYKLYQRYGIQWSGPVPKQQP